MNTHLIRVSRTRSVCSTKTIGSAGSRGIHQRDALLPGGRYADAPCMLRICYILKHIQNIQNLWAEKYVHLGVVFKR